MCSSIVMAVTHVRKLALTYRKLLRSADRGVVLQVGASNAHRNENSVVCNVKLHTMNIFIDSCEYRMALVTRVQVLEKNNLIGVSAFSATPLLR
jgi:hypothetical protein